MVKMAWCWIKNASRGLFNWLKFKWQNRLIQKHTWTTHTQQWWHRSFPWIRRRAIIALGQSEPVLTLASVSMNRNHRRLEKVVKLLTISWPCITWPLYFLFNLRQMITNMLYSPQKKKLSKICLLKLLTHHRICIVCFYSVHQGLSCPLKSTEIQKPIKQIGTILLYLHCMLANLPILNAPDWMVQIKYLIYSRNQKTKHRFIKTFKCGIKCGIHSGNEFVNWNVQPHTERY